MERRYVKNIPLYKDIQKEKDKKIEKVIVVVIILASILLMLGL